MNKAIGIFVSAASMAMLVGGPVRALAADSSSAASDAATQQAVCDTSSSQSGVTATSDGSKGSSSTNVSSSTSPLSASSASGHGSDAPSAANCPECPENLGNAVQVLASPPTTTSTSSATSVCDPGDVVCLSTNDPNFGTGNPLAPVTQLLPTQGIVVIGSNGTSDGQGAQGDLPVIPIWIFYDGYPDTMAPFGGYAGINGYDINEALLGLVASTDSNDDFNRLGGNMPLIGYIIASLQQTMPPLLPGLNSSGTGTAPECDPADLLCIDTNDANAGTGNPITPITEVLPSQGIVALGPYNPDTGQILVLKQDGIDLHALYLFYDGDPTDIDPLGGYVGLNTLDFNHALLGLVASLKNTDNFNRAGGNLPLIGYPTTPLTSLSPALYHVGTP
jgi:hypothetical protein